MTIMMQGLYNALISVGADKELAEAAAIEAADLDTRFTKLETAVREGFLGLETAMERRVGQAETSVEHRIGQAGTGVEHRIGQAEVGMERRASGVEQQLSVVKWMLGVVIALNVAGFGWMTSLLLKVIG